MAMPSGHPLTPASELKQESGFPFDTLASIPAQPLLGLPLTSPSSSAYLPPPLARDSALPGYNLSRRVWPLPQPTTAAVLVGYHNGYPSPAVSEVSGSGSLANHTTEGMDNSVVLGTLFDMQLPTPLESAATLLDATCAMPAEMTLEYAAQQIDRLLRQATIDQLTSPAFDSWIFFLQRLHEQGRTRHKCVLRRHWWDELRQERYDAWLADLAEGSEASRMKLEQLIRQSARMSW